VLRSGIDKGGMGESLLSKQHTLSVILDRNLSAPKALKRHEDHIVAVVLGKGCGHPVRGLAAG
jgi:hypothetical protein